MQRPSEREQGRPGELPGGLLGEQWFQRAKRVCVAERAWDVKWPSVTEWARVARGEELPRVRGSPGERRSSRGGRGSLRLQEMWRWHGQQAEKGQEVAETRERWAEAELQRLQGGDLPLFPLVLLSCWRSLSRR